MKEEALNPINCSNETLKTEKEKEKVDGKNKNNRELTKERKSFFRGKTKYILILIPAILLLTCTLALPMASGQFQATALPQTNSINSNGNSPINAKLMSTIGSSNGGMSLIGSMTVTGDSLLNGKLTLTDAEQVILGSPLTTVGTMNVTGDSIEIGKPCYEGGTITLTGNESNPSVIDLTGNIYFGSEYGTEPQAEEVFMNITDFHQYVESNVGGWIGDYHENGDWSKMTNDLPLNNKASIKVHQGTLTFFGYMTIVVRVDVWVVINSTHFYLDLMPGGLWIIPLEPYDGWANVTQLKNDPLFPVLLKPFIGDVMDTCCLFWTEPTTFEAKGPWFALGPGGGIINMLDTHVQMRSNDTIIYEFLDASNEAAFRITPSAHYPKAGMNVTTQEQNITGLGLTYITNCSVITDGTINIKQQNQIINSTIDFEGEMLLEGNTTVQGDIGIRGDNYMQGLISVGGYLDINNGLTTGTIKLSIDGTMETTGSMNIINGEINIPSGSMIMNSTGSFITGDTITITGEQINSLGTTEANGNTTMRGDFEIGGDSLIGGPVSVSGSLSINNGMMKGAGTITVSDGYMKTVGSMKISNGVIEVLNGKILMDPLGTGISSETSITGDLDVAGTVTSSGNVRMKGNFQILTPLSIMGSMVTIGITSMGDLGAINGILTITGNVIMSGMTVISGDNNVIGSMTVTPFGVAINGIAGLMGVVHTTGGLPIMSSSTILEVSSGSMMGMPIPHTALMVNPLALLALGILGFGTVWVVFRSIYYGIKERRTLVPRMRRTGENLGKWGKRLGETVRRLPSEIRRRLMAGE